MRKLVSILFAAALAIGLGGCSSSQDSTARKLIVTAAHAQRAGADAFKQAKLEQAVAIGRCRSGLQAKGEVLQKVTLNVQCASGGYPLPYDQALLDRFPAPLNALYDSAHMAENARKAATSQSTGELVSALSDLAMRLFDFLKDVKLLPVDPKPISNVKAAFGQAIGESR